MPGGPSDYASSPLDLPLGISNLPLKGEPGEKEKLLTRQNLPNSQVTERIGLRLVLPSPCRGGKSSDLGFDLLPRSLGIVAIKHMGTVCLEN